MAYITIYSILTGEIQRITHCPDFLVDLQARDYESHIAGVYPGMPQMVTAEAPETYYVDLASYMPTMKVSIPVSYDKSQIAADGVDQATITLPTTEPNGTPITVYARVDGQLLEVDDGILEFSCDTPGVYTIHFSATNYLDNEIEVTVNEV